LWIDSGAGNGTALYELSSPWLRGHGTGLSLLFSVDGTLRNWLREPHRSESLQAYRSELLRSTLLHAEIFSAAVFAAGPEHTPNFDPFASLGQAHDAGGRYDAQRLVDIDTDTTVALDALSPQTGADITAAVALGFVIDALAGHSIQPNAPGFSYERWELSEPARDAVVSTLDHHARLVAGERRPLQAAHEAIVGLAQRHLSELTLSPDEDTAWSSRLAEHADSLKRVAFALGRSSADEGAPSLLHEVGNALWSWHFFLEDRQRWKDLDTKMPVAVDAVGHVRRWLERPWGLLTTTDIKICLAGSPSDENLPPLAGPVIPLFTGGYDALRASLRNPSVATDEALLQLIRRRCLLRDLRNPRGSVLYPRTQEMALAELLGCGAAPVTPHQKRPLARAGRERRLARQADRCGAPVHGSRQGWSRSSAGR
jgi:hypothetical protein